MEAAKVFINLNNKVLIQQNKNVWLWGQVQDVSPTAVLVDLDIPERQPQWLPFNRVFRPPFLPNINTTPYSHYARYDTFYKPKATRYVFVAARATENNAFVWRRRPDPPSEDEINSYSPLIFSEVRMFYRGEVASVRQVVPNNKLFLCICSSQRTDEEVFTINPVTNSTFYKMEYSGDQFGVRWLKMAQAPKCFPLKTDSKVACLVFKRDSVTVIAINDPEPDPVAHARRQAIEMPESIWKVFSELGNWTRLSGEGKWSWENYEDWERAAIKFENQQRAGMQSTLNAAALDLHNSPEAAMILPELVLIEVFDHLDTLELKCIRRVCSTWNRLVISTPPKHFIWLRGTDRLPTYPDCGLVRMATPNNYWYAGNQSPEYRMLKVLNFMDNTTRTLHLSNFTGWSDYEKLFRVFRFLNFSGVRFRTLILQDCSLRADFEREEKHMPKYTIKYLPTTHQTMFGVAEKVIFRKCSLKVIGALYLGDLFDHELFVTLDSYVVASLDQLIDVCETVCNVDEKQRKEVFSSVEYHRKQPSENAARKIMEMVHLWEKAVRKSRNMDPLPKGDITSLHVESLHKLTLHALLELRPF